MYNISCGPRHHKTPWICLEYILINSNKILLKILNKHYCSR